MRHHDQNVAAVFHEGDDALRGCFVGWCIIPLSIARFVFAADPVACDGVNHEAQHFFIFAPLPAVVHAPDGGCGAVLQLQQRLALRVGYYGSNHLQLAIGLGELQGGLHFIALAHALFFVGSDAFGSFGRDVFDAIEVFDLFGTIQ